MLLNLHVFRWFRPTVLALFALQTLVACSETEHEPTSELNTWLETQSQTDRQFSPMHMSRMNDRRLHGDLDEVTDEAFAARLAWKGGSVNELREHFTYEALSVEEQASYDAWVEQYEQLAQYAQVRALEYVFEPFTGPHLALPAFMIEHHDTPTMQYMGDYNRRIRLIGVRLAQWLDIAKTRAHQGVRPPQFAYQQVIEQAQLVISGAPFDDLHNANDTDESSVSEQSSARNSSSDDSSDGDSMLWQDAQAKAQGLLERGRINERGVELILEDTRAALTESLAPAYEALIDWLQDDIANTEANPVGVSRHPGGREYYNYLLSHYSGAELNAEQLHQFGLKQVARLREQIEAVREREGIAAESDAAAAENETALAELVTELRQAALIVVDTGLHAKQWTYQQGIDYLLETTPATRELARTDVQRAMVLPGEAAARIDALTNEQRAALN